MNRCPVDLLFQRLLAGELSEVERQTLEAHVIDCPTCEERLAQLSEDTQAATWRRLLSGVGRISNPSYGDGAVPLHRQMATAEVASQGFPVVPGYELLEVLGQGGMGVVYKARQTALDRIVALKMILPDSMGRIGNPSYAEQLIRFRAEAEAAAHLQHPSIVGVHEIGECRGVPYFSLEFVEGGTLAQKLAGTPLPATQAAGLAETLAQAVHAAHQRGIVHRDLKPANILLTADGVPKITDFGLAKRLDVETGQTQSGAVLGTASYMAPEQAAGKTSEIGPTVDIYALGAILYEMLTGRPPFKAVSVLETLDQVRQQEPVPPRHLHKRIPRDLETICLKCLEKMPGRRYASAQAVADDLRRFQENKPIAARPVGAVQRTWRWCRRNPVVAALTGAVAVALIAGTATAWFLAVKAEDRAQEAARQAQRAEEALALMQTSKGVLALEHGNMLGLLDVLEGRRRAMLPENQQAYNDLWSGWHAACAGKLVQIFGHDDGGVFTVAFSKDGRSLLTASSYGTVQVWDTVTGEPKFKPFSHRSYRKDNIAFSPDGQYAVLRITDEQASVVEIESGKTVASWNHVNPIAIHLVGAGSSLVAIGQGKEICLYDLSSLQPRGEPLQHDASVQFVAVSANGKLLAAVLNIPSRKVQLWNLDTRTSRQIKMEHEVQVLALSKDGRLLATTASEGKDTTVRLWDTATGRPVGEPLAHGEDVKNFVFSPDGRLLATAAFDGAVRLWHCDAGKPHGRPLRHDGPVVAVAFHPSGRWLASGSYDNTARVWDVESGELVGWPLPHQGIVSAVTFAHDGKWLATASADGTARLWDWSPAQPKEFPHKDRVWGVAFSPDGEYWASCSQDGLACLRPLEPAMGRIGNLSYSERWLAHPPADNSRLPQALGIAFHPDNRHLVTSGPGLLQAWSVPAGEQLAEQWRLPGARHVAISPDGQWLATGCDGVGESAMLWRWHEPGNGQLFGPRPHPIEALAFHPKDANLLAVAGSDKEAYLWDIRGKKVHGPPLDHGAYVDALAISPDGRMLATGGRDQTIRFWNLESHQTIGTPIHLPAYANALAFSPNSRLLASASSGGAVQVWEVTTRLPYGPALPHGGFATSVAFSPDGRWLATGSFDKKARLWSLPRRTDNLDVAEMQLRTSLALGARLNAQGLVETIPWQEWQQLHTGL